jgi:hypothetical protein
MQLRRLLHTQRHAVRFNGGFAERDVVRDETNAEKNIQNGVHVWKFLTVFAPFIQSLDARSARSNHHDDSHPSPGPLSMQTEETISSGAHLRGSIMLSMTPVSSIATRRTGALVFRTKSINNSTSQVHGMLGICW